ncbi:MAG: hypothetical protein QM781_19790 [Chitinophagaceae bacterium]
MRKKISPDKRQLRAFFADYKWANTYFITTVCKNRFPFFGNIINEQLQISSAGIFVMEEWLKTPSLRKDMNLLLHDFVIMPDHFHGIIQIGINNYNETCPIIFNPVEQESAFHINPSCRPAMHGGPTDASDSFVLNNPIRSFGPQSKNLSSIIRGFKSSVTQRVRKINPSFAWQPRFHDRIIRNEKEYEAIVWYIQNNVQNYNHPL